MCKCINVIFFKLNNYYYCCCLVIKSCLILCDPMDCSLSGSSIHGISQERILEWVAISFSENLTIYEFMEKKNIYIYIYEDIYIYMYVYTSHTIIATSLISFLIFQITQSSSTF